MRTRWILLAAAALLALAAALLHPWKPPEPIRIGVLHSLTGAMATSEAPLVDAVRLAAEEINAAGGLLGRPLELVVADGRSDWDTFAAEAERLIAKEKVSALFACWTSACRKAIKPVVEKHDHLMFYPVQYEGLEQSPNIVYLGATPNQQIIPGTRWALDRFGKRVYLLGADYVFPRTAHRIIRDFVAAAGGTVLGERTLPLNATDFDAVLADIRRQRPDVVLNTLNGDGNRSFFRALRRAGLENTPVLSFSIAEHDLAAMGTEAFHPAHYAVWSYFQSLPDAANRRFVADFRDRFGPQRVTSDPIEAAYSGVRLWAVAVREAGSAAPAQVNRIVGRVSVPGPSGIVAVDASTRHLWKWIRVGHARPDGQFELVQTSENTVRPVPFPPHRSPDEWRQLIAQVAAAAPPERRR
jgi:urea transport system substrate-binding protein